VIGASESSLIDSMTRASLRSRGLYRPVVVRALIKEDGKRREDHSHLIWKLLCRKVWFRTFRDVGLPDDRTV